MKDQIIAYLNAHKEEMLADISDLVRINSEKAPAQAGMPYGVGNAKVLDLALSKAAGYGFVTTNYDNYVGSADMNDGEHQLDILAHLDVVPVNESGWKVTGPFEPKVVDGRIYGRGTADDKGPAMAALYAMRAVKELGIPLSKNVRLILGCDEECGSSDIAYYYSREKAAKMTFSPDACFPVVNVEKGHWISNLSMTCNDRKSSIGPRVIRAEAGMKFNVIPGEASLVLLDVSEEVVAEAAKKTMAQTKVEVSCQKTEDGLQVNFSGISGHAASPEHANNALTAMLYFVSQKDLGLSEGADKLSCGLISLAKGFVHGDYAGSALGISMSHEVTGPLTISLDMLTLKENHLLATFDSRVPLCGTKENTVDVVHSFFEAEGFTATVESFSQTHYVSADSDFVKTLLSCYEMYSGKKGFTIAMGGGTYVHNVENGVAFGCVEDEDETNLHGNDEHIAIDDLITSSAIFAQAIIELCK